MAEKKVYTLSLHEDDAKSLECMSANCRVPVNELIALAVHRYIDLVKEFKEAAPGSSVDFFTENRKTIFPRG